MTTAAGSQTPRQKSAPSPAEARPKKEGNCVSSRAREGRYSRRRPETHEPRGGWSGRPRERGSAATRAGGAR
eukprot:5757865-Pyramimonas_sp.AAC.1